MPRIELTLNGEARAVDAHEGATLRRARGSALPMKDSLAARFISGKK
jgi:hypothetical protein